MRNYWWKILGILLVLYSIIQGLLGPVPARFILNETIRNLYFHVPMWFAMIFILFISLAYSIKYLYKSNPDHDIFALQAAHVGIMLGILGVVTGSLWAKYTWGSWWTFDAKLNGAAMTMLIYMAYFILRNSIDEEQKRARISAVYSIFAYVMMIVFIGVLPRMVDSLHPGNGGNPGFGQYDLDNRMRLVFYPAIVGWILIALWIMTLKVRIARIEEKN